MANLFLFGLTCPLANAGAGLSVNPPRVTPGDSAWKSGAFSISLPGADPSDYASLRGSAELRLQGLRVWLSFNGLALIKVGEDYRPDPGADGSSIGLALGSAPQGQRRLRIGPSIIDGFSVLGFDGGALALGLLGSPADWLTGNDDAEVSPISVRITPGQSIQIDLAQRQLLLPPQSLAAVLSAHGPGVGDRKRAEFRNQKAVQIPFGDIAANKTLALTVEQFSGAVPLNVPESFTKVGGAWPSAPIEAPQCLAWLELTATKKSGASLSGARLMPVQGGVATYTFQGLRNARNHAERWQTANAIDLAFRPAVGQRWSTPLLAPADPNHPPVFERLDDSVQNKVIPFHGWFGASQFRPDKTRVSAELLCAKNTTIAPVASIPSILGTLQFRATRPWLRFENSDFHHSRPGTAYQGKANTFVFKTSAGHCGGAPLLPRTAWEAGESSLKGTGLFQANADVNGAFSAMVLEDHVSVHETGIADRTNGPGQPSTDAPVIKAVVPDARVLAGTVQLEKNERRFDMASPRLAKQEVNAAGVLLPLKAPTSSFTLPIDLPDVTAPDFAVLWPDQDGSVRPWVKLTGLETWAKELTGAIDPAAPIAVGNLFDDLNANARPKDFPLAILKVGRGLTLQDIFSQILAGLPATPQGPRDAFEAKRKILVDGNKGVIFDTDPAVVASDWVGLAVFDAPIDFDAFPLLKAIVPSGPSAPRLSFLTVSPRQTGSATTDVAMSGAIDWTNSDTTTVIPADQKQEATFKPQSLSVAFRDRRMTKFNAKAELTFYSFFGVKSDSGQPREPIFIVGSAKRVAGSTKDDGAFEIRFAAEVAGSEELILYPMNGQVSNSGNTFIKSASLKRVEVVDAPADNGGRKAEIQMDGDIAFRKPDVVVDPDLANFFNGLHAIDFSGLRIDLPDLSGAVARLLELKYPSLSFNLDLPHISLLGDALSLKFRQLVLDWEAGSNTFDLGHFPRLPLPGTADLDWNLPKILFLGRLDFGSLPDLFARSLSGFSLDGLFGLNVQAGKFLPTFRPFIGIGGFGFDGLNFDLMSFLTLRIAHLNLGSKHWSNNADGAALHFEGAWLEIVGIPVLKDGSGAFFSQDHDAGNGFWAAFRGYDLGLLTLDWGFVGQNIDFPPSIPKALLAPPPDQSGGDDYSGLAAAINKSWDDGDIIPASGTAGKGWTFAASIQAFGGAFKGRVLFQDGGFAGLSLWGDALKQLLSWDFVFTGIYRKDITPGEDYFYFSVTLPAMTFGTIHFTGGGIAAEIYTSGDFMADIGFPWPAPEGGRQWDRTIGAIVTPGQASGGFYVRKRETHVPDSNNKQDLTISGGVAVQWGLGAAFGGGVFNVWVRIGIYAIAEGSVTLRHSSSSAQIVAFTLQGAAGVLLEGEGSIDWWIISIRVGVRASAEIRVGLIWDGRNGNAPVLMPIEAELSVSAYAEACIGGGCARICRSIHVGIDIPVRYQLQFG